MPPEDPHYSRGCSYHEAAGARAQLRTPSATSSPQPRRTSTRRKTRVNRDETITTKQGQPKRGRITVEPLIAAQPVREGVQSGTGLGADQTCVATQDLRTASSRCPWGALHMHVLIILLVILALRPLRGSSCCC